MTGLEYQKKAMRTCNQSHNTRRDMLFHAVFGLNAEAGEVASIFQKTYQGHPWNLDHFELELGDCLWMLAEACQSVGTTLDIVMERNIAKLQARYPDGFDPQKSLHRREGDD